MDGWALIVDKNGSAATWTLEPAAHTLNSVQDLRCIVMTVNGINNVNCTIPLKTQGKLTSQTFKALSAFKYKGVHTTLQASKDSGSVNDGIHDYASPVDIKVTEVQTTTITNSTESSGFSIRATACRCIFNALQTKRTKVFNYMKCLFFLFVCLCIGALRSSLEKMSKNESFLFKNRNDFCLLCFLFQSHLVLWMWWFLPF
ncbi:hypothetical protein RFI_29110 [Reticulomyxa filosa]|uniref:Uncharacterized protein n=1 Tax=Reticulomyxa filosa TaxID=46433 RepID=X6M3T5_RETFI|nr:hypothetical protein RFI_29110 [Reticulomyxa filosa]|eukprot:ETO08281.1 hypothetical protein RFI_29110 [Reticulomyxa filosa]